MLHFSTSCFSRTRTFLHFDRFNSPEFDVLDALSITLELIDSFAAAPSCRGRHTCSCRQQRVDFFQQRALSLAVPLCTTTTATVDDAHSTACSTATYTMSSVAHVLASTFYGPTTNCTFRFSSSSSLSHSTSPARLSTFYSASFSSAAAGQHPRSSACFSRHLRPTSTLPQCSPAPTSNHCSGSRIPIRPLNHQPVLHQPTPCHLPIRHQPILPSLLPTITS